MNSTRADAAFHQAYRQYADNVYQYALARLDGNADDAADCVQESFIVYYKRLQKGETILHPRAFLYQTAANFIKKRYTALQKEREQLTALEDACPPSHSEESRIIASLDFEAFNEALNRLLNESEKELYRLRFEEEYSVRDIAAALNIQPHAATVRIARLKEKIKKALYEYY